MKKFSYNGGNLIVEHLNVGMISDTFKILRNEDNLTNKEIATILNNDWYGEDNKLDFSVFDTIIRIVEHL